MLDAERGATDYRKPARLNVCLIFPDRYELGMSNLGFHQVYSLINAMREIVCERGFFEPDLTGISLETGRPLGAFDVLAFALPFELNYLGMLKLLEETGIGMRADQRGHDGPLILAGGVAAGANPEPLADFVDAVVIGDAEPVIEDLLNVIVHEDRSDRRRVLNALAMIPGVYVPSQYKPEYSENTLTGYTVSDAAPMPVARSVTPSDHPAVPARSVIYTEHTEFGGAFLVEMSRGCPRRCRFCLASAMAPCRFFSADRILDAVPEVETAPKVGLVGASVSDHPDLETIVSQLVDRGHSVTLSSLRPDMATEPLMAALVRGGRRSVTFAPEVGSPAMAQAIGKQFAENTINNAVTAAVHAGLRNVKLYFMIGMPNETDDDVSALIDMVRRVAGDVRGLQKSGRAVGSVTVTVNCFIPKPLTAFENKPMCSVIELRRRIRNVFDRLRSIPLVTVHTPTIRWGLVQASLSRGDRRAGRLLDMLVREGAAPTAAVRRWINETGSAAIDGYMPGTFRPWDIIRRPE